MDVKVLVDDKGNKSKSSIAAMNLIAGAGIPIRAISSYAIHHDKYIVVDGRHTETGSFNYSQAAPKSKPENVIVLWNNTSVAGRYLSHWENRWAQAAFSRELGLSQECSVCRLCGSLAELTL